MYRHLRDGVGELSGDGNDLHCGERGGRDVRRYRVPVSVCSDMRLWPLVQELRPASLLLPWRASGVLQ